MPSPRIDQLRPATFRGVPFQVDGSSFETGRRTQVHEYPQRDKPYAQDLGRSTRQLRFDAFVVGDDYVQQSDAVLGAIEEGGAGTLVHPWFGSLNVNVISCRLSFDRGLGVGRFELSFVESGELAFPSSAQSTAILSRQAASGLEALSVDYFAEAFKVLKQISAVADDALTTYGKVLGFLSNPVFALSNALGFGALPGNISSLAALFGTPIDLGWNFASQLNLSGKVKNGDIAKNDATLVPTVRGLSRMATDPALAHNHAVATTASRERMLINQNAINAQTRQLLLVQAVGLSSYLQCAVYDDINAVKNELASALDAEALLTSSDDLYQSLAAARSSLWRDLTDRSRDSARLVSITPPDVLPMLVTAYDYYEDAGRDLEIVARNRVKHPGFVGVEALLVLSR